MFCGNCGKELPENALFCGNCGTKKGGAPLDDPSLPPPVYNQTVNALSPAQNVTVPPLVGTEKKLRHGFTSFWLWSSLIVCICGFVGVMYVGYLVNEWMSNIDALMENYAEIIEILQLFFPAIFSELNSALSVLNSKVWFIWLMVVMAAATYGWWQIIRKWNRAGFYWLIIAGITFIVYCFTYESSEAVPNIVGQAIYLGLTFGVLRLRNSYNGKSTWEQLGKKWFEKL